MNRILIVPLMLACSVVAPIGSQAVAQSPDPALLAPPAAQAGLAAPVWQPQAAPRYAVPTPRPGGNTGRARTGTLSR
jgi:hypothetical protein